MRIERLVASFGQPEARDEVGRLLEQAGHRVEYTQSLESSSASAPARFWVDAFSPTHPDFHKTVPPTTKEG